MTKSVVLAPWHPVEGHRKSHTSSKSYSWRPSSSTTVGAAKSEKPGGSGSRKHPSTQGGQPPANQAPGPQPNRNNNNRGRNRDEIADSIVDARDIINARCRSQLADNFDRFQALSRVFDNVEYPKDFKPMNIHKYDGKQEPAQWLRLYSAAVIVAGGDTNTKVLYFPMAVEPAPLTWLESLAREYTHGMISRRPSSTISKGRYIE